MPPGSAHPEADLGSSASCTDTWGSTRSLSRAPALVVSGAWTPLSPQQPTLQPCISPSPAQTFVHPNILISLTCLFIPLFFHACSSPNQPKSSLSPLIPPPDIPQGSFCIIWRQGVCHPWHVGLRLSWEPWDQQAPGIAPLCRFLGSVPPPVSLCAPLCAG